MTRASGGGPAHVVMLLHKPVFHDGRVRREASTLVRHGYRVTVLHLAPSLPERLDGAAVRSALPARPFRRLPGVAYNAAFALSFLARAIALRPDIVHVHDAAMLPAGAAAAWFVGARLIYDTHELATGVPYRSRAADRAVAGIERVLVPRADAVITVSDGIAERLKGAYGLARRPAVVRNVPAGNVPSGATGPLRRRLGLAEEPIVLHQGALGPDRGGAVLVRAVARLPGVQLVFLGVGDREHERDAARVAESERMAERTWFVDPVPLHDLLEYTADADVGVSLLQDTCENHRLALPNKVFEYLAAGVPVVVGRLPELRRLVEGNDVGRTAVPDSPEDVAEALRAVLDDRVRLGRRAARVGAELRWPIEEPRLVAAYAALCDGERRA